MSPPEADCTSSSMTSRRPVVLRLLLLISDEKLTDRSTQPFTYFGFVAVVPSVLCHRPVDVNVWLAISEHPPPVVLQFLRVALIEPDLSLAPSIICDQKVKL